MLSDMLNGRLDMLSDMLNGRFDMLNDMLDGRFDLLSDGNDDDDGPWSGRRWCFEWPNMARS